MIVAIYDQLNVRVSRSGTLLPWIGPALRGLVAERFKDAVCQQPVADRRARWKKCAGCEFLPECSYGRTFEPDPPAGAKVFQGQGDAARPLVLAPYFPLPERVPRGLEIPLRVVLCGRHAQEDLGALLEMVDYVGRRIGVGPEHVKFELAAGNGSVSSQSELTAGDLPVHPDAVAGTLPRVGIGLTAPLFLRSKNENGKRRANTCPQFSDLLRASLRTVGQLFRLYGEPLDDVDFVALKAAAEQVRMVEHCYEPFKQRKWSSRSEQRFCIHGVVGGGVYENVPLALLPWLTWGGRLHVGNHRVAGAGGWRVVLD